MNADAGDKALRSSGLAGIIVALLAMPPVLQAHGLNPFSEIASSAVTFLPFAVLLAVSLVGLAFATKALNSWCCSAA